jgi:putative spermidine/putrescine transport system permease protein
VASVSRPAGDAGGGIHRVSAFLFRHPRLKLGAVLAAPLLWFTVVYLGALGVLFVSAFWRLDVFTAEIVKQWGFSNFETLLREPVYRTIAVRTIGLAAAVTLADIVLSFPLAYFAARIATPRVRTAMLLMRLILTPEGVLNWAVHFLGFSLQLGNSNWAVWLTFVYLWLPFMLLPIYGSMERVPSSYLEASSDLGAKGWVTFRRVVFPLILPGIVAGSIFSFSLTLGDYIVPSLVGNTQFIGTVIYQSTGISNNVPFAAAYAFVPVLVMGVYLVIAKRMGAFDAL